jgi:hypothetical protein
MELRYGRWSWVFVAALVAFVPLVVGLSVLLYRRRDKFPIVVGALGRARLEFSALRAERAFAALRRCAARRLSRARWSGSCLRPAASRATCVAKLTGGLADSPPQGRDVKVLLALNALLVAFFTATSVRSIVEGAPCWLLCECARICVSVCGCLPDASALGVPWCPCTRTDGAALFFIITIAILEVRSRWRAHRLACPADVPSCARSTGAPGF